MTFQREAITNTNRMYILKCWYPATTTSNGTFKLIFIECELVTNCSEIKLTEHLDHKWVMREELLSYEFIEGDIEFVNSLVNS